MAAFLSLCHSRREVLVRVMGLPPDGPDTGHLPVSEMAFSPEYLEATDRDDRRQEISPTAGERSVLTQFPLPSVKNSNFFSCRLTQQQPSKEW